MSFINKNFDNLTYHPFGTENISILLYSLVRFCRPQNLLEVGIGQTTLFLSQALKDISTQISLNSNHRFSNNENYYQNQYSPKLDSVDNFKDKDNENYIIHCLNFLKDNELDKYVTIINQEFWDYYLNTEKIYDFVWWDAGTNLDYYKIIENIYPKLPPGGIIVLHNILYNEDPNIYTFEILKWIKENSLPTPELSYFLEPHKNNQNSFVICKKPYNKL